MDLPLLQPQHRVLTTLDEDGRRHWLTPRLATGRFWHRRRIVAYLLVALYTLLPFISINGKPAILLNVARREFTFFGYTFLPTDTLLLVLFLVGVLLAILFGTAIAGRLWCGWACPQTVYMEYVFRPLERVFLGAPRGGTPRKAVAPWRIAALYFTYFLLCVHLANTFLAYFVGVDNLHAWIWTSPPWEHPAAFAIVAFVTALMMFDFAYWREQLCIIGCPYGRFQSVMLDRHSLIVAYDYQRGEPRGKGRERSTAGRGSCVDCGLCVAVCPTGIDIRDGLQLECINCTQCIDACDEVMDKTRQPRGLIRYSSQASLEREPSRVLRPRIVFYAIAITGVATLFAILLFTKSPLDVTILRGLGRPYIVAETGEVENYLRVKIVNRTNLPQSYTIRCERPEGVEVARGARVDNVAPGESRLEPVQTITPATTFTAGRVMVRLIVADDQGREVARDFALLGPMSGSETSPDSPEK